MEEDIFYLISVNYDGEKGCAVLKLYDPKKGIIKLWHDNTGHKPYFYTDLTPTEIRKIPEVISHKGFIDAHEVKLYDVLNDREVVLTKVIVSDPLSVGGRKDSLREIIKRHWEANIRYHLCYIYDRELIPGLPYEINDGKLVPVKGQLDKYSEDMLLEKVTQTLEGSDTEYLDYLFEWAKILNYPLTSIRRIAIDIEVLMPELKSLPDPSKAKESVIAIAVASNDGLKRVLLLKRGGLKEGPSRIGDIELIYYTSEKRMLQDAFEIIKKYPMVVTFNGDSFDLRYLYHRALKLGISREDIPIGLSRDEAFVEPGVHLDLYKFFSNRAIKVYAFGNRYKSEDLNTLAETLLGKGKIEFVGQINELNYEDLAKYCFNDAELTLELTTFNDDLVMKLIQLLMRISKLPLEDVTRLGVSKWVQSLLYYELRRKKCLIPNAEDILAVKGKAVSSALIKGKKYMGARVIEPRPGLYFDVIVLDFASLYPSIIKAWNLSFETVNCPHSECKNNKVPDLPHWVCKRKQGISKLLIGTLRDLRVLWYKPLSKDESLPKDVKFTYKVIQAAMKVILNAAYGVFGSENFALYCPPMAESITAIGRYCIDETLKKAEEMGMQVLYGDTDSLFIHKPTQEKMETLIKWAVDKLKIDLEVDKIYRYVSFSERKKNYFGILEDGSYDVKGLKGKKRDTPDFLRESFNKVIKILSNIYTIDDFEKAKVELSNLIESQYKALKSRRIPLDKLAIRVQLSKSPEKYTKTTPPHVKAAVMLQNYNINVGKGMTIAYVKVKNGVKPLMLARADEIDVNKYIEHMRTVYEQLLDALGIDFDTLIGRKKEEYLTKFFG